MNRTKGIARMLPPATRQTPGRRQIIRGFATLALLGAIPFGGARATHLRFSHGGSHREAIRLGRIYLKEHPAEQDAALLRSRLPRGCDNSSSNSFDCDAFANRRAADFAAGDTVLLDGWVFARSEARLLALTALS
jgi:hypothetical protein